MSFDRHDAAFVLGFVLTTGGLWMVYPPLGLVFPGLMMLGLSLWRHVGGNSAR